MSRTTDLGPYSTLNNCVADILEIARTLKPVSIRVALKRLKLSYTDNMCRRRIRISILRALKIVPAVSRYKTRNEQTAMYTETIYAHVHHYPGPYVPAALCNMLSVDRRRAYDVFTVLRAMGLVYRGEKHYGLISELDDKASYWWSLLCNTWGCVDRDALVQAQVMNLIPRCDRRKEEPGKGGPGKADPWPKKELEGNSWTIASEWFRDISEFQNTTATVPNGILQEQEYSPLEHYVGEDTLAAIMRESDIGMLCIPEREGPTYEQTFECIVQSL